MKQILVILLFSLSFFTSCKQKADTTNWATYIIGTWKVDKIELEKPIPESEKQFYSDLKENFFYTVKKDGTFERFYMGRIETGKWKLDLENQKLIGFENDGFENSGEIIDMEADKMIFVIVEQKERIKLHLLKKAEKPEEVKDKETDTESEN